MRKILLFAVASFAASQMASAQCNDLFISEYVEGSHNNKALEIYNPTNNAIAINNNYRLVRWQNGATNSDQLTTFTVNIPNYTLFSGHTLVIVLDRRNPLGTGQDTMVFTELQAKANMYLSPDYNTNSTMSYNGDDAMSLQKFNGTSWVNIDVFGVIGERPVNGNGTTSPTGGWTAEPDYHDGNGEYWSKDRTLVRKANVTQGNPNAGVAYNSPGDFNPSVQWDSLPENTFSKLGFHQCACTPAGLITIDESSNLSVYPNPAKGENVTITADRKITSIEVYNSLGQVIAGRENSNTTAIIETRGLNKGMYIVKVTLEGSGTYFTRITLQ